MPGRNPRSSHAALPPEFRTRGNADLMLMRSIVGFLGLWQNCRKSCRRRKGCASPNVACFDLNRDQIAAQLEALAAWPRLDGPREPEATDGPLGESLFD